VTLREQETRRRRRQRAEGEYAVGGPLIDAFAPVIGGDDLHHPDRVRAALRERAERLMVEGLLLASYFADGCWVVAADRQAMLDEYVAWQRNLPGPYVETTHSTHTSLARPPLPKL
jgi:hypothetical protein